MKKLSFDLKLKLEPKRRVRARAIQTKAGKWVATVYEDAKTRDNVKLLQYYFKMHMAGKKPFEKGERLAISAFICTAHKRGDIDNYLKTIFDAANAVLWNDDSQIKEIEKVTLKNSNPENRLVFSVWGIE